MASTATSTPHMSAPVVLPSIHEMFPEHLMPRARPPLPPASLFPRNHFAPPPSSSLKSHPTFSFDVLKSDPRGASLQHIASSRPHRRQPLPLPAVRTQPRSRAQSASSSSSDGDDMEVDGEEGEEGEDGEGQGAEEGKKHVCPTCAKRFNRPSSLRIHVNTHTGATPFRCPHPSCGRAFNVNSNMRRHYRNHASGALAPASHGSALAAGSPVSPVSPRWGPTSPSSPSSASSTSSRFSPPTPEPLALSLPQPHAWPPAPGKGTQMRTAYPYSESDVRSERRWR